MTTNYHTAISVGAAANAATFNTPLGALDEALTNAQSGVYNVLEYGASPSETAANNVTYIQAAINAASAVTPPGKVFIPRGTYEINAALTIATNGVSLVGEDMHKSTLKLTAAGATIKVDKGSGNITYQVEIGNIYINGNSTGTTALTLVNANECYFHDLLIISAATTGISIQGQYCGLSTFDRITTNSITTAVDFTDGGACWFTNCNFYDSGTVFRFISTTVDVSDIHVRDSWFETFDTAFLWDCPDRSPTFTSLRVADCYFVSTNGGGTYACRILKSVAASNDYSIVVKDVQLTGCYFSTTAMKYVCEVAWSTYVGGGANRFWATLRDNYWHISTNATAWFKSSATETSYEYVKVIIDNPMHSGTPVAIQDGTEAGLWQGYGGGSGAAVSGKCWAVEHGDGVYHQTVLHLTLTGANDLDLADGADHGAGVKIYDFPAGRIQVVGATINASAVCNDAFNANPNDIYYLACGSVTAADDGDLTDTEADIIPKTTIDTTGNTVLTNDWHAALATSAQFDGTSSALDLYVNAAVADASTTKAATIAITGTMTITWINLGDY